MARTYVASFPRFTTIDPEAERSPWLSPYLYCNGNPVNNSDPDGRHTMVKELSEGYYEIIGGKLDGDLNVYVYTKDDNGAYTVRGRSIGQTPTETSFYDSDKRKKVNGKIDDSECWQVRSKINMNDMSGQKFLSNLIANPPLLPEYIDKARGSHPFDFKTTNGTHESIKGIDVYRGMPFKLNEGAPMLIASARDIGNIGAGYVAAYNGVHYMEARFGFDLYQFSSDGHKLAEGLSTQNAELWGYTYGAFSTNYIFCKLRLIQSIGYTIPYGLKQLFK